MRIFMCNNKFESEGHKNQYLVCYPLTLITCSVHFGIDPIVLLIMSSDKIKNFFLLAPTKFLIGFMFQILSGGSIYFEKMLFIHLT